MTGIEEDFLDEDPFFDNSRNVKKLRKIKSKLDRSKFKVSNQKEIPTTCSQNTSLPLGRVIKIASSGYEVFYEGITYLCSLKGRLKKVAQQQKNLIVVGDKVRFEIREDNEGVIDGNSERSSLLSRSDNLNQRKQHIIAANIDQVLITCSVVDPLLKPHLIDRYIIAALKGGLAPVIIFNKMDLLENLDYPREEREIEEKVFKECFEVYQKLSYPVLALNKDEPETKEKLIQVLNGKSSVFSGQSGVGKTSLINLISGLSLKTKDTVRRTKKGSHTTTTPSLIPLDNEGFVIDTPGIKSFAIWNLEPQEVLEFYPDFEEFAKKCHYPNCRHLAEPNCHVKRAVTLGTLSQIRYDSYKQIINSLETEHQRR